MKNDSIDSIDDEPIWFWRGDEVLGTANSDEDLMRIISSRFMHGSTFIEIFPIVGGLRCTSLGAAEAMINEYNRISGKMS